jgi:hypothetical protein
MTGSQIEIVWTDYMKYRAKLRGFDLAKIEHIVRYSGERYFDTMTRRLIAVGRIDDLLVIIPCDAEQDSITPVTIHATTRQQVRFRLRTGRFISE